jgi:DNA-binding response OmpR family regulator
MKLLGEILIAEDEDATASFISKTLRSKGYSVTRTGSVKEALKEIEAFHYGLVLIDIGLLDMMVKELIKTIREMDHDILVVMISEPDTSFDFESSRADGCLMKPILAENLLNMVDERIHF